MRISAAIRSARSALLATTFGLRLGFLADVGFDPIYGARPLKRTIQRELETVVARGILSGEYGDGDEIRVDVSNERLWIHRVGGAPPAATQEEDQEDPVPFFFE